MQTRHISKTTKNQQTALTSYFASPSFVDFANIFADTKSLLAPANVPRVPWRRLLPLAMLQPGVSWEALGVVTLEQH